MFQDAVAEDEGIQINSAFGKPMTLFLISDNIDQLQSMLHRVIEISGSCNKIRREDHYREEITGKVP